jgi:hypothetical protein
VTVFSYLIVLVVVAGAVFLISAPLRAARSDAGANRTANEVAELEAARDAKYREIRDAEMDVRTGKLSDSDYEAIDQSLRAEAVSILHELDEVSAPAASPATSTGTDE